MKNIIRLLIFTLLINANIAISQNAPIVSHKIIDEFRKLCREYNENGISVFFNSEKDSSINHDIDEVILHTCLQIYRVNFQLEESNKNNSLVCNKDEKEKKQDQIRKTPQFIGDLVQNLALWPISQTEITQFSGGISTQNFRIKIRNNTGEDTIVLRYLPKKLETIRDPYIECKAQNFAHKIGVGPGVISFDPVKEVFISEFVNGKVLNLQDKEITPDILKRVVESIKTLHDESQVIIEDFGKFEPLKDIEYHYSKSLEKGVKLPKKIAESIKIVKSIDEAISPFKIYKLCHNDLNPGNIIDDGEKIHLIDFEYAGVGNIFYELTNFAKNLNLSYEDILDEYFGEKGWSKLDLSHMRVLNVMLLLDSSLWSFWKSSSKSAKDDIDYYKRGLASYDKFLTITKSEQFSNDIKQLNKNHPYIWQSSLQKWKGLFNFIYNKNPKGKKELNASLDKCKTPSP